MTPDLKKRTNDAIKTAASWLFSVKSPREVNWRDYPYAHGGAREALGLSGIVLHALHVAGSQTYELDRQWLDNLPDTDLGVQSYESNSYPINLSERDVYLQESVRHLPVPWTIIAISDSYPNGTLIQRTKALHWLSALLPRLKTEVQETPLEMNFTVSELAIALRYLRENGVNARI